VRGLDALVVGRVRHDDALAGPRVVVGEVQEPAALGLRVLEVAQEALGVGRVEVVARVLLLRLPEHVAIGEGDRRLGVVEGHGHDVVRAQHVHGEALEPVGELARDGAAVVAPHLLEVGELRHLHAVAPHLPAQAPGAQRRALPVVLHEAHVVEARVDADGLEAAQVKVLEVGRARLDDHLELVVVLEPVGVLAVAPVRGPPRRLDVGRGPGARAQRPQRGGRVKGPRAHLHVVGLQERAALARPVGLEAQDDLLERAGGIGHGGTLQRRGPRVGGRPARVNRGPGRAGSSSVAPRGRAAAATGVAIARPAHAELCCGPLADARHPARAIREARRDGERHDGGAAARERPGERPGAGAPRGAGPRRAGGRGRRRLDPGRGPADARPRAVHGRGLCVPGRGRGRLLPGLGLVRGRAWPLRPGEAEAVLARLAADGIVPGDAVLVDGSQFRQQFWPLGTGAAASEAALDDVPEVALPEEVAAAPASRRPRRLRLRVARGGPRLRGGAHPEREGAAPARAPVGRRLRRRHRRRLRARHPRRHGALAGGERPGGHGDPHHGRARGPPAGLQRPPGGPGPPDRRPSRGRDRDAGARRACSGLPWPSRPSSASTPRTAAWPSSS
jgi:hypothetical protein